MSVAKRVGAVIAVTSLAVLAACASSGTTAVTTTTGPAGTGISSVSGDGGGGGGGPRVSCDWQSAPPAARKVAEPATSAPSTGTVTLAVATTQGPMAFTLKRADAPCTVASFISLTQQKYYDKTPCHRLVTAGIYVLQCGDPTGTGSGGPGYSIPDEASNAATYPAGTVAMARTSQPHSGGSQFFIVYKTSPALNQSLGKLQYTVFGSVSAGLAVVSKVAAAGSDNGNGQDDGTPNLPITITSVTTGQ